MSRLPDICVKSFYGSTVIGGMFGSQRFDKVPDQPNRGAETTGEKRGALYLHCAGCMIEVNDYFQFC